MAAEIDGYKLLEAVGRDEFGDSHLASSRDGSQVVWLSLLQSAEGEQPGAVLQKLERAARIQHPNVVAVLDQGKTSDDSVYQVMELLEN